MSINRSLHRIAKEGVLQTLEAKDKEIERLQNIIKEVKEYLKNNEDVYITTIGTNYFKLLEILDKGDDDLSIK